MGPRSSYRYPTGSSTHLPVKRTTTRSVSVSSEAWPRERKSKRSAVSFMMPANSRFISATDGSDRGPWKSSTMVIPSPKAEDKAKHANAQIPTRRIVEATELRLRLYQQLARAVPANAPLRGALWARLRLQLRVRPPLCRPSAMGAHNGDSRRHRARQHGDAHVHRVMQRGIA